VNGDGAIAVAQLSANELVLAIGVAVGWCAALTLILPTAAEQGWDGRKREDDEEEARRRVQHGEGLTGEPSRLKLLY
jgi:hypothetical protein